MDIQMGGGAQPQKIKQLSINPCVVWAKHNFHYSW